MKPKPYGAQNTKFLEYERSSLIPLTSSELLKFENRTSVIIEISRFSGHRCPGINEGVFATTFKCRQPRPVAFYKTAYFCEAFLANPFKHKT